MNVTLIKKTIVFKTAISLLFVLISQTLYSQTDYDGQFEVLKVISSDCGVDTDGVSVLPNPNNGEFTVTGIEEGSLIQIVNITGQVVYEEITTSNFAVIQLNACSKGIYFLRSQTDRTNQVTKFIVK